MQPLRRRITHDGTTWELLPWWPTQLGSGSFRLRHPTLATFLSPPLCQLDSLFHLCVLLPPTVNISAPLVPFHGPVSCSLVCFFVSL